MKKNTLALTFGYNKYKQILKLILAGKPLRADQKQVLYDYCYQFGPDFNEYLKKDWLYPKHPSVLQKYLKSNSFLAHHKPLVSEAVEEILQHHPEGIDIDYQANELAEIRLSFARTRMLSIADLILVYGNQTLTSAPFMAGGLPHIEFFEWGNVFGVIKYVAVTGETDTNILVHFEKKQEQTLEQYKLAFARKLIESLIAQNDLAVVSERARMPFNLTPRPLS